MVVKALLCPVSLLTVSGIVATVGALLLLLAWFSLSCGPPDMTLLPSSLRGCAGVANDSCPSRLLRGDCWRTKPDSGYGLFLMLSFPEDPFLCFPPVNGFPVFFSLLLLPFCSPPLRLVKRFTHAEKGRRLDGRSATFGSAYILLFLERAMRYTCACCGIPRIAHAHLAVSKRRLRPCCMWCVVCGAWIRLGLKDSLDIGSSSWCCNDATCSLA